MTTSSRREWCCSYFIVSKKSLYNLPLFFLSSIGIPLSPNHIGIPGARRITISAFTVPIVPISTIMDPAPFPSNIIWRRSLRDQNWDKIDNVPIYKLFIGNISPRTTSKDLEDHFSKFGKLESVYLKRTNGTCNFAFLIFASKVTAVEVLEIGEKNGIRLHKRYLRVKAANSWNQPDSIVELSRPPISETLNLEAGIHVLNADCLHHIFSFLPIVERVRLSGVCKLWKVISEQQWVDLKELDFTKETSWGFKPLDRLDEINTTNVRRVLLSTGTRIKKINLSVVRNNLNFSILPVIAKLCTNLQSIDVSGLTISTTGIYTLSKNCCDIRDLSLGSCITNCDVELSLLFSNNAKLKSLRISNNSINGKCFSSLSKGCIERIDLRNCNKISPQRLFNAIKTFARFKILEFNNCITLNSSFKGILSRLNIDLSNAHPVDETDYERINAIPLEEYDFLGDFE